MEILNQLRNVYATLNRMTVSGDNNIECMYGCYYGLSQVIQQLEQEQAMQTRIEEEKKEAKSKK